MTPARRLGLSLTLIAPLACSAASPPMPSPGHYRIDGEATTRSGSGPTGTERTERWDGATGQRTVTTHAGPTAKPAGVQTHPGTGPVTWCVPAPTAAPAGLPDRCSTRLLSGDGATALQAECRAGRLQEQWKQLDAKTWQRQMSFTNTAGGGGNDPSGAVALASRGLSPADAAKARAEVAARPGPQGTTDAMAPVYAQIEATSRNGAPDEAAAARHQLAALKAAQSGVGPGATTTTTLTERWTRIADTCKPGS